MMSTVTYDYADEIFTLYTGNTLNQIADGADPAQASASCPNGIDLDRFGEAAQALRRAARRTSASRSASSAASAPSRTS